VETYIKFQKALNNFEGFKVYRIIHIKIDIYNIPCKSRIKSKENAFIKKSLKGNIIYAQQLYSNKKKHQKLSLHDYDNNIRPTHLLHRKIGRRIIVLAAKPFRFAFKVPKILMSTISLNTYL